LAVFRRLRQDIRVVFERDPAARTWLEVLLCYPGVHALIFHRMAHWLWRHNLKLLARWLSTVSRFLTQIEIHPAAKIGEGFFIDHGSGVVIGETCEIGDNVTIYQGVTLGGTGNEKGKRHPTIGNNVVIGNGARILGSFKVGDGAKIGAGAVVLQEVPAGATVVGNPGRVVRVNGQKIDAEKPDLNHHKLPDPVMTMLECLQRDLNGMAERIAALEEERDQLRRELAKFKEDHDAPARL
jgi:serine O-acetyltransferase